MAAMAKFSVLSLFCMLFVSLVVIIEAAPQSSLVTHLPGFNANFPSKHYSGYISIDGKNLFYYFVVSERNPASDPVVLWLNGGPGCSSFDGFVYEHGPFNFAEGKSKGALPVLHLNPYSWSKWFQQFPEFQPNPLYISGESYAGVYVPTLASQIAKGINKGTKPTLNLKGYLVGNGVTDRRFDRNALVPFAHGMALISDKIFQEVVATCGTDLLNVPPSNRSLCHEKFQPLDRALDELNVYDILEPCYHGPGADNNKNSKENKTSSLPLSFQQLGKTTEKPLGVRKRMFGRAWPFRANIEDGIVPSWPQLAKTLDSSVPCINDEVATLWLNTPEVREAIQAQPENVTGPWELCTDRIRYSHDAGSMIPYHQNLTTQGYRALIYSGDHDMCVPYTGSEAWTASLGYKIVDEWRPWFSSDNQVAGYLQGYANSLTFLTIKGAGHTVAEYKPREALDFFQRFLGGKRI
ncbi:serine carboxypeptidase-like 20 isoform X2 [Pyrus x bretschneideri]|uniref:serine carboxypeptidase-like 20 isoform X2 n=1 Tax=Pyrus x bretschneideri TaxID=225117 RepID=UPI00202FEA35|nr:serine carboxypeptidase-like 20 isoform X2 [Pyrus x bretschneideri]